MTHLPLAHRVARQLHHRLPKSVCYDDLIRYGLAALPEIMTDFSPFHGLTFKQYAAPLLFYRMIDGLRREYPHIRSRGAARPAQPHNLTPITDADAERLQAASPAPDAAAIAAELRTLMLKGLSPVQQRVFQLYLIDNLDILVIAQEIGHSRTRIWQIIQDLLAILRSREDLKALAGLRPDQPFRILSPRETRFTIHGGSITVTNRKRWPVRRKGAAAADREGARRQGSSAGANGAQSARTSPAQDGQVVFCGAGVPPASSPLPLTQPPAPPSARKESQRERLSA